MYKVMVNIIVNRHDPDSDIYAEEYSGIEHASLMAAYDEAEYAVKLLADDPNIYGVYVNEV